MPFRRFSCSADRSGIEVKWNRSGDEGTRTPDFLLAKQALYQLSYIPETQRLYRLSKRWPLRSGRVRLIITARHEAMQHRVNAKRLGSVLLAAFLLATFACARAVADPLPNCWDIVYGALRHRAAATHPPFVVYNELSLVTDNGDPLIRNHESVAYRDDGVSRVWDERFGYDPYVTRASDPGPPELGPYGSRRSVWLPVPAPEAPSPPLIGEVRAHNSDGLTCTVEGIENYRGHQTFRLSFESTHPERPALHGLWIDTVSAEIWKVDLSGTLPIALDDQRTPRLAQFQIELDQVGQYVVINHVTWKYRYHEFAQYSDFFGEYYYSSFKFPDTLPATYFS